jgi:hypothetical protein
MSTYQNQPLRFGLQGLVLKSARDVIDPTQATILSNLTTERGGKLLGRAGQTQLGQALTYSTVHSLKRLNAQKGGIPFKRFYGIDTTVQVGTTGSPAVVDTGYSGNPLWLVPYRSEIAGDAWMYIADSAKMAKVSIGGILMPIGLPIPVSAPTTALGAGQSTVIDAMNVTTGWTGYHDGSSLAPTISALANPPPGQVGNVLSLITNTASPTPYLNWMDKAVTVDLTQVGSLGAGSATDADFMHLWMNIYLPNYVGTVQIFLVTSAFTTGVIPGTSTTQNLSGYSHTITPSSVFPVPTQPSWLEFGSLSLNLTRGDFTAFGNPNWATVTGIVIVAQMLADPAGGNAFIANLEFLDFRLYGGYSLNSSGTNSPYDWRVTNYDPRTGAESNGTALIIDTTQVPTPPYATVGSTPIESVGQAVVVSTVAYGNAAVRQRFYRRGGTVNNNWYFDGVNTADGAAFTSTASDAFVFGTGLTVPLDHFQPIATVDTSGNTVLNQPVPALWGPLQGMLFACGDPYRPGWLYCSKPTEPDHWFNAVEVCSGTEALLMGCIYGDRGFVFSAEQCYQILPNLDTGGGITTLPTACKKGLVGIWALTAGLNGIYLVARDGIYRTSGDDAGTPISDDIRPLFEGTTVNGYGPVDFTQPAYIRLFIIDTDLWFTYRTADNVSHWLLYSILYQQWRDYTFANQTVAVYQEENVIPESILFGELTAGYIDTFSGTTDRGTPISWHLRTGAMDQGSPRSDKRYGNWALDFDAGSGTILAQALTNDETTSYAAVSPVITSGRCRSYVDPFSGTTVRARNLSMDLSGTTSATPVLYLAEMACAFEPADYLTWETDEIDHGLPGWQIPLWAWFALRGTTALTLTRTVYDDTLDVLLTDTYTLTPSSVKTHVYVPFAAIKGVLFQYRIVGTAPFRIYDVETTLMVQPISGPAVTVHPFGTQDSAVVGTNPLLAAMRPGGTV